VKGDRVPDADHVSRLCGGSHIREDGSIAPTAFRHRPNEDYLSVNWLEFLQLPDRAAALAEVGRALATQRSIGATARLAVLNAGVIRQLAGEHSYLPQFDVRHETEDAAVADLSHSGIYCIADDDLTSAEFLSRAILGLHPAK
jgi:hypothetical protein